MNTPGCRAQDGFVDLKQGRIYVKEWIPENPRFREPILLLHDSLGCVELWREFPSLLCDHLGRRVVAYDRLGFGRSDPRSETLTMSFMADESRHTLPALLSHLGDERVIAFGHSVGGEMALLGAGTLDCFLAVISESAQAFVEDRVIKGVSAAKRTFAEEGQIRRLERYHGNKARWVLHAWIDTWLDEKSASWSLEPDLPKVRCPVLAIHGDQDEFGSARHPELICAHVRGSARLHILEGCGHVPHKERPEEVLALVSRFLQDELLV